MVARRLTFSAQLTGMRSTRRTRQWTLGTYECHYDAITFSKARRSTLSYIDARRYVA